MKHVGPLLGYNNNVPYKGHVYHVQTEDSGSKRPHVITHLFADGGRIVKTKKTSYAHFVATENLTERVRALMRDQHKNMVISLRVGELDHLIDPAADPKTVARDMVETSELPPSAPLELIDRAAVQDERDFHREMEELATRAEARVPSQPPGGDSPGTYSFVGRTSAPPKKRSVGPESSQPAADSRPPHDTPGPALADHRTDPVLPRTRFGERFITERRFDDLVEDFLRNAPG